MGSTPENDINASTSPCSCVNGSCPCSYGPAPTAFILTVTTSLSLFTVLGNALVMLSISVNRHLRTVNNYFLFSLAVADLFVGLISVNLYALYRVKGRWPLGAPLCDLWLFLDYAVSNASVMNLLLISLDRYFCVTRPLSYPARRTGGAARLMIAAAWLLSLLLWAPPILCWQTLPTERPIPEGKCYVQMLASPPVTLGTTLISFYLPAVVMIGLYGRIMAASRGGFRARHDILRMSARPPNRHFPESRSLASSESETKTISDCLTQTDPDEASKPQENGNSSSSPRGNPKDSTGGETKEPNSEPKSPDIRPRMRGLSRTCSMLRRWQERRRCRVLTRERKVTNTVLAILMAFIVTWMPYNVMAVVGTFCRFCVPSALWATGYWMCYINSAINPGLYALFNVTFRRTFLRLLRCSSRKT